MFKYTGFHKGSHIPFQFKALVTTNMSNFISKEIYIINKHVSICRQYKRMVMFGFVKFN